MSSNNFIFTSESVTEGHPDKMADQISDSILDAMLTQDPYSRVACETLITTGLVVVSAEIKSKSDINIYEIVRNTITDIGYTDSSMGFDPNACSIIITLDPQSDDIAIAVHFDDKKEQGAGDQGLMFGYACNENPQLMPSPIMYAHKLSKKLSEVRKNGTLPFLGPDGKSQVTFRYKDGVPVSIENIVISSQHSPDTDKKTLDEGIMEEVIKKCIDSRLLPKDSKKIHINPTGRFVTGGPKGDTGLTGRKIIIDTYGGWARHGGGAFSGKDPSKVDRSAAYMARYIAKNVVASELAEKCEVQLAYAIGVAEPVSVMVDTFKTGKISEEKISETIKKVFDLKPSGIISTLNLLQPIYRKTATYGHFGRDEDSFTWEKTDKVEELLKNIS